ncbi:crotonyl-CoA carboxylase/reductase [Pelagibacteraceae bacterium]|jgi:crotonyl-CoA carboxylase/reductase|nr:crotonyl-CoA carboxylase/reductase [Pelagibacteraceae bacterium]MDC3143454.1 crotonyl-CoA carboxylase/reductase [Pelagibacteraceae bacterium]MDC3171744.1 crotonyl-CoA carboxylase/reductase [Pelagibacteraceae bacterium]|tara:strand:- start:752 stop:1993 length:1242 start_codon:yes stop_codon:yes gene_type:complete
MTTEEKDIYAIGEVPPLGFVPNKMHAWVIRKDRHGNPMQSFQSEEFDIPEIGPSDVLVLVMAAGVNYNGVWAGLGKPISVLDVTKKDYHIAGSDASGIVWKVGSNVKKWKVGDEVVIHAMTWDHEDEEVNGGEPMLSESNKVFGYETADGTFAQFTAVQAHQLMRKPPQLSWEESGCYNLTLVTAYRMLFGHAPNELKPGQFVLVWGASGGLGSFAVQLASIVGAKPIGVISDNSKAEYVKSLGAVGVLNRKDFNCWGEHPDIDDVEAYNAYMKEVRKFGKALWEFTGKGKNVDMVFEHPGETTVPVSMFIVKRGGMVVICAGTTGYNLTLDARYLWMHSKRLQGSHFGNSKQANAANNLVHDGAINPCMSEVFEWDKIPLAHEKMMNNEHKAGNMAVLVGANKTGLKTIKEA